MEKSAVFEYRITVFTPTYNRAYTLPNLYSSLINQTVLDFEWLIVDDGSTDNTESIVSLWLKAESPFPIRYYKKENGGKHRAINFALSKSVGELFFIVDSDDCLTDVAIEMLISVCNTLPHKSEKTYAGIAGCKGYHNGQLIGTTFNGDILDCLATERAKHGINGDKAEAFFTEVLREYPFPEFEGEKFVTEAAVWDRMAMDGYLLRYFNEVIYLCEYLEDGLTNQGLDLYYRNPQGYGYYLRQARKIGKFPAYLQTYYDVECFLHWQSRMNAATVADLIGTEPGILLWKVIIYQLRQYGSKCKQLLLRILKKGSNP